MRSRSAKRPGSGRLLSAPGSCTTPDSGSEGQLRSSWLGARVGVGVGLGVGMGSGLGSGLGLGWGWG